MFRLPGRTILVHSLVLGSFLLFTIFLAGPLFDRLEAIPGEARQVRLSLPDETGSVRYHLERIVVSASALELHGWAFIENYSTDNKDTFLVLKSAGKSYLFDTSSLFNNTVTARFGGPDLNLDWSGFLTVVPMRKIEKGVYTIGLYLIKDEVAALQYTDKVINRSGDSVELVEP